MNENVFSLIENMINYNYRRGTDFMAFLYKPRRYVHDNQFMLLSEILSPQ